MPPRLSIKLRLSTLGSKQAAQRLPKEVVEAIALHSAKDQVNLLAVSKHWNRILTKKSYRSIRFSSVLQRDNFFESLSREIEESRPTRLKSPTKSSPIRPSPLRETSPLSILVSSPPPVHLPRAINTRSRLRNLPLRQQAICSLHFGLGPRKQVLQMPSVKSVLARNALPTPTSTTSSVPESAATAPPIYRNRMAKKTTMASSFSSASPAMSPSLHMGRMMLCSPNKTIIESPGTETTFEPIGNLVEAATVPRSAPATMTTREVELTVIPPEVTYGEWEDRFINPFLPMIPSYMPNLKNLSLSGCHINDWDFGNMLEQLPLIERLDISYSTVKNVGLEYISRYLRSNLTWLDVSGIFRFGRNKIKTLGYIAQNCKVLTRIVAIDCPEIEEETYQEIMAMVSNRLVFGRSIKSAFDL